MGSHAQGGVFLTGDWYVKGGDTATTRLRRDRKTGKETYPMLNRCERFAYVRLPPGNLSVSNR